MTTNCVHTVVELDKSEVHAYPGSYERYLVMKEERLNAEALELERMEKKLSREKDWMAKQPRARQAKSKARQEQFYELSDITSQRKEKSKEIKLKIDTAAKLGADDESSRLGSRIFELEEASYTVGSLNLLKDFSHVFKKQDKIAFVGGNG